MKVNLSFDVEKNKDEIVFNQGVEKRMKLKESVKELNVMRREKAQLQAQADQMKVALEEKKLETDLEKLQDQIDKLTTAEEKWSKLITPLIDDIRKEITKRIKKEKVKMGWKRVTDGNERFVKMNTILAPICNEYDLDMTHPIIMELKNNFDKI
jgi:hypothetical protein